MEPASSPFVEDLRLGIRGGRIGWSDLCAPVARQSKHVDRHMVLLAEVWAFYWNQETNKRERVSVLELLNTGGPAAHIVRENGSHAFVAATLLCKLDPDGKLVPAYEAEEEEPLAISDSLDVEQLLERLPDDIVEIRNPRPS